MEAPEPVAAADAVAGAAAARHDALHDAQVQGLRTSCSGSSRRRRRRRARRRLEEPNGGSPLRETPTRTGSAGSLVVRGRRAPLDAPRACSRERHARARGAARHARRARRGGRRAMLGLAVPDRLAGARSPAARRISRPSTRAPPPSPPPSPPTTRARAFDAPRLRARVACELAPPTTYQELHAVVPVVASAAPGGGVVCWSDDFALWARRARAAPTAVRRALKGGDRPADVRFRRGRRVSRRAAPRARGRRRGHPVLHHVAAMQWSASGQRLLALLVVHVATAQHVVAKYRWLVWDPPRTWLNAGDSSTNSSTNVVREPFENDVGVITMGRWHVLRGVHERLLVHLRAVHADELDVEPERGRRGVPCAATPPPARTASRADEIEIQHFPQTHARRYGLRARAPRGRPANRRPGQVPSVHARARARARRRLRGGASARGARGETRDGARAERPFVLRTL